MDSNVHATERLIEVPIEIDGVAMVSIHDERAQTLAKRHKRFSMYLNRFTSEFGQQISPALLYRMALTSFLDLKPPPVVKMDGETDYLAHWRHVHDFGWFQSNIEAAIATVMLTQEEYRQRRQGQVNSARARSRHIPVETND